MAVANSGFGLSTSNVQGTLSNFGGSVADLYAASGLQSRAKGARIEAQEYGLGATEADLNAQFTKVSTDIKQYQTQRSLFHSLGSTMADVASSGFANTGSALDIERDSAMQGELTKAVLGAQGQIEEAGYEEQAASFRLMQQAANEAATAADNAAKGAQWGAAIKGAAAGASAGAMLGPWGALAGGVIGGAAGLFAGSGTK